MVLHLYSTANGTLKMCIFQHKSAWNSLQYNIHLLLLSYYYYWLQTHQNVQKWE